VFSSISLPPVPPCFLLLCAPAFRNEMGTAYWTHHWWKQWTRAFPSSAALEAAAGVPGAKSPISVLPHT